MKVYLFLLKGNKDEYEASSSYIINGKRLYAITNNDEYAKEFIDVRDMSIFTVVKLNSKTSEEYERFLHNNGLYNYELTRSTFPTQVIENDIYTVGYVSVVCTINESDLVEYDFDSDIVINTMEDLAGDIYDVMKKRYISLELVDAVILYPKIFNKEIENALDNLDFEIFINDIIYQLDNLDTSEYITCEDKLKVFCKKFANTYKEG